MFTNQIWEYFQDTLSYFFSSEYPNSYVSNCMCHHLVPYDLVPGTSINKKRFSCNCINLRILWDVQDSGDTCSSLVNPLWGWLNKNSTIITGNTPTCLCLHVVMILFTNLHWPHHTPCRLSNSHWNFKTS